MVIAQLCKIELEIIIACFDVRDIISKKQSTRRDRLLKHAKSENCEAMFLNRIPLFLLYFM